MGVALITIACAAVCPEKGYFIWYFAFLTRHEFQLTILR